MGLNFLALGKKKVPSIQMNKVLKEQSGLGESIQEREHFPRSHPNGSGGGREAM